MVKQFRPSSVCVQRSLFVAKIRAKWYPVQERREKPTRAKILPTDKQVHSSDSMPVVDLRDFGVYAYSQRSQCQSSTNSSRANERFTLAINSTRKFYSQGQRSTYHLQFAIVYKSTNNQGHSPSSTSGHSRAPRLVPEGRNERLDASPRYGVLDGKGDLQRVVGTTSEVAR